MKISDLTIDYINEVLNENIEDEARQQDEWEGGLTFIAKSSRELIFSN